jgi:hypothetical protein
VRAYVDWGNDSTCDGFSVDEMKRKLIADPWSSTSGIKFDIAAHLLEFILADLPGVADFAGDLADEAYVDVAILLDPLEPDAKRRLLGCPDAAAKNLTGA